MLLGVARRVRRLGDGAAIQMQILDVTCIAPLAPTGKKLESRGAGRKHGVHALPAVHYRSFQVQPPFLGGLARVRVHGERRCWILESESAAAPAAAEVRDRHPTKRCRVRAGRAHGDGKEVV